jgi:hypothetical protein
MRVRIALITLLAASAVTAGTVDDFTFTMAPPSPMSGEPVQVRVDVAANACYPLPPALVTSQPSANVTQYEILISDTCAPNLPSQSRTYDIGPFPAGLRTIRFALCAGTVFGYVCSPLSEITLTVRGALNAARTVPALSSAALAALIGIFAAIAALLLANRRA